MNQKRPLLFLISALILGAFMCGCTTTDGPIVPTPINTPVPTMQEPWPVADPIIIKSENVPNYKTEIRASPMNNVLGLYVSLDIDAKGTGSNMASEGDNLFIVGFAYNYAAVPKDFTITSYKDVTSSGIPYKSMTDRIYPMNKKSYPLDVIGLKDGMQINPSEPYNYGAIIMLRDEM
ncbi:MAG: hypothetical protein GX097_02930 [Methanomicrobiales archaeon]|jgi:hypothetical protein|nr:hypothetical protein [Methanomicrobiales archaeon]